MPNPSDIFQRRELTVAGLISGTSMDALDIAFVRFEDTEPLGLESLGARSVAFAADLRARLLAAPERDVAELARLDVELGRWMAEALERTCRELGLRPDLIGSHGQTVWHEHGRTTLQIGEPAFLAQRLDVPVVHDFRRADIAAGGCGAPLAPIFDDLVLRGPEAVIALNIGGIANLTALPPKDDAEMPRAFDCGPGSMILDALAERFTGGRLMCDRDGAFAARGVVDERLLASLLDDPWFDEPPPRSTGREAFGSAFTERLLEACAPTNEAQWHALFATLTAFSAEAIARSIEAHVPGGLGKRRVIASGGGVHNPTMMAMLNDALAPAVLTTTGTVGVDPDFKEAMAFALLAFLFVRGRRVETGFATGARHAVSLGRLTLP